MPGDDLGFTPEPAAPNQATPPADDGLGFVPAAAAKAAPENDSDLGFVPEEKPELSTGESILGGAEALAHGFAGPVATAAEAGLSKLGVPNLSAEDVARREEGLGPLVHGGLEAAGLIIPGMLTGGISADARAALEAGSIGLEAAKGTSALAKVASLSQAGIAEKAAAAVAKSTGLGKIAQSAIKLGLEGGALHAGDNVSKMILGQTDPEAPVASLLAGMPAAVLLGGALGAAGGKIGSKLEDIAASKAANKYSQFMADFGNGFKAMNENADPIAASAEEAQHLYQTTAAAIGDGFELKRESMGKLLADMTPEQVSAHVNDIKKIIDNAPRAAKSSPAFQDAAERFIESTKGAPSGNMFLPSAPAAAEDAFNATDQFKRALGEIQFHHNADPQLAKAFDPVRSALKESLENEDTWGKMGYFQKNINKLYSDLQNPTKFFEKAATGQTAAGEVVNPDKIRGLIKKIANEQGSLKQSDVLNFIPLAKKALQGIDDLHSSLGIESNIPKVSTNTLDEMMSNSASAGLKASRALFTKGPGSIGWAAAHAIGTAVGTVFNQPYWGFRAGEHLAPILSSIVGNKLTRAGVAGTLRALSAGEPEAAFQAAQYAQGIKNGAARIENSVNNVFLAGGKQYLESDHSDKDREKLDKHVEQGTLQQRIQNSAQPAPPPPPAPQGFAHGGEVLAPEPAPPVSKPVGAAVPKKDHIAAVFPEQAMLLGAAKGRVNNYLNQIRPKKTDPRLPFDDHIEDKAKKKTYHRALDIANKPLSVLDHVKNGTLEPEHMQHLNQLYPELTGHLQKKMSEKIAEAQMKNEKPPYKVRQSLSLFMGSALDSNLTPQNILAAQSTFSAQNSGQPGGMVRPAKGAASLENAPDQYRTSAQSAQLRQTRPKP